MADQGDPHLPRLFAPGVVVLLGFVLLVGNPWLNRDITIALSSDESAFRLFSVLFHYPSWYVDVERIGPFLFWYSNLRTVVFVALAVAGLTRVSRWLSKTAGGVGLFVTTVGLTTLSAVIAGLASAVAGVTLLDTRETRPYYSPGQPEEFVLGQLGASATFGVLFGVVLGATVVAMHRRTPATRERRVNVPKSFW